MRVNGVRGSGRPSSSSSGEDGFLLIGVLVAVFLVLLVLSIAAPTMARQLRREREVEAVHRGDQYVRAVQLYYKKTGGHYPGSMEQLEKTNNIRFLRQKYVDPMTGKADWRLIHVGEQKTTVKGFFGQPLTGVASSALGSASGTSFGGGPSTVGGGAGSPGGALGGSAAGGLGSGGLGTGSGGLSAGGTGPGGTVADGSTGSGSGSAGVSSQSATSFKGSGAPIVGFGSSAAGSSMVVLNEQTTYPTWEFIYDPRIEALKAKVNLLGGGMASSGASSFGSGNSLSSPPAGSSTPPASGSPPTAPSVPTSPQ